MNIDQLFEYIDEHQNEYIENLKKWITIKSVSAIPEFRPNCFEMVKIASSQLESYGCNVHILNNPLQCQKFPDGSTVDLPPIILASFLTDPSYKTVCIYGHLDVQPAEKEDGWNTEPFEMMIDNDVMIGRGTNDDKGPLCGWIAFLDALKKTNTKLKINLKFVFECMEETGSVGLNELLISEKDKFLKNVDYVCITDNSWIGTKKPCVTYGLRGVSAYSLEVSGSDRDLHSGMYGGTLYEPMNDLIFFLSQLTDENGKILIPRINDQVAELTPQEKQSYETVDFDPNSYAHEIGCKTDHLVEKEKISILMNRWRYPCLSIHGIEGAFSQPGFKTVIPCRVIGKFSIRSVPNMDPAVIDATVDRFIKNLIEKRKSPNKVTLHIHHAGPSWVSDITSSNYQAASRATKRVHNVEPDFTREGGSIPVTLTFQNITNKSVVLLPMGRGDDGAHSQNEKLNKSNFINGIKLFTAYIDELSKI